VFQIFNPIGIKFSVVLDQWIHQLSPEAAGLDDSAPATSKDRLPGSRNPARRITPESRQRGQERAITPNSLSMNGFGRLMISRALTAEAAAALNSRKKPLKKGTTYTRAGGETEIRASRRALSSGAGDPMTAPGWRDPQVLAYRWSRL
jgi:hypothetical protein